MEKCEATFRLSGVYACAQRVTAQAQAKARESNRSRYSMGWEVEDSDYINSVPDGYLDLPVELQGGLPDNYAEIAQRNGWKMLEYRSRTVPNPPFGSYSRVLFLIEGESVDKWIQFTLPEDPENKERLIDFIAMEKPTGPDDLATPYYTQYYRDAQGNNPRMRTQGSFDNCYSCHPNGMRELSPEPGSYSAEGAQSLDYMQEAMQNYTVGRGSVDYKGALHPENYGPPAGQAQGCVKCHNNGEGVHEQSRGAINDRHIRTGHVDHKMTQDFSMPVSMLPGEQAFLDFMEDIPETLSESERQELMQFTAGYKRRQSEMDEAIINWLASKNKIDEARKNTLLFTLNGHPNYPNCMDQPDCFKGLRRYRSYLNDLKQDYPDQMQAWMTSQCQELIDNPPEVTVNDSNRSSNEGFLGRLINTASEFLNGSESNGEER